MKLLSQIKPTLLILCAMAGFGLSPQAWGQANRNTTAYNLQNGIGLKGYDPVAIFPEGGGQPQPGQADLSLNYEGVTYLFANEENRSLFTSNPDKYEPTYGGWCAWAMASGSYIDIQPIHFTIHGNRAHYFAAARAKKNFDRDLIEREQSADGFWKQLSGEDPRL